MYFGTGRIFEKYCRYRFEKGSGPVPWYNCAIDFGTILHCTTMATAVGPTTEHCHFVVELTIIAPAHSTTLRTKL